MFGVRSLRLRMQRQSRCAPHHVGKFRTSEPLMPLIPSLIALIHPTGVEGTGSVLSVSISAISGSVSLESPRPKSKTKISKAKPHSPKPHKRLRRQLHTPKPESAVAISRVVAAAGRAPHAVGIVEPRAAAQHAVSACSCAGWISFWAVTVIDAVITVVELFPQVSCHII